jgi:general secretion pathway protein M
MIAAWNERSPRERLMLTVGAALVGLVLVYYVILLPLLNFRDGARQRYEDAVATYGLVDQAAARPADGGTMDASALRSVLTRTAQENGIVVNRINSEGDGVDLTISGASMRQVYGWLAFLYNEHGVRVTDGQIQPASDGRNVNARLTVRGGA